MAVSLSLSYLCCVGLYMLVVVLVVGSGGGGGGGPIILYATVVAEVSKLGFLVSLF